MKVLGKQVYRFDGVELDPARGCLSRNGEELAVRQKSIRALQYLLEQRHRLVTKEELIEHVWEGMAVTDDALVQLIKEIRHSLGDDPHQPRFIKTVPKAGYRFVAPVEEFYLDLPSAIEIERQASVEIEYEEEITGETRGRGDTWTGRHGDTETRRLGLIPRVAVSPRLRAVLTAAVAAILILAAALATYLLTKSSRRNEQLAEVTLPALPGKKPLAVMYFENRVGNAELDWLREGLADMVITDLSRSAKLTVLSRQQLHLLLERTGRKPSGLLDLDEALGIARRSRAEALVTGSFTTLDGKIRIEVQLHDARNGQLLAAEHFVADRPNQILTQIDLLSLKLASHLGAAPAEKDGQTGLADVMTNNLEAYRYYSLAVEKAQALHNTQAIALLEKATALDPQFAMAYARIGYAYSVSWGFSDKGKPFLEKAFQLSGRLTEKDKLYITGWYAIANLDYAGAINSFREIIAQYPLEIEAYRRLAHLLRGEGQVEEALEVTKRGLVIDTEAKDLYNELGGIYLDLAKHDEAIPMYQRYVELAPEEPNAYDSLGLGYQWAGRYNEAIQEYERALALNPEFDVAVIHLGNTYFQQGRYRVAIIQYKRYIQVASSDAERARGYGSIAHVYWKRRELAKAERAAKKAMSHDKTWPSIIIALERGSLATAEKLNEQFFKLTLTGRGTRGSQRQLAYLRGYIDLKSRRATEAVDNFKEALRHQPLIWNLDSFEDCLANAYLELGNLDQAITEYERILRLNPNYPLAHYHLGQAYERKGQRDQARAAYERFLQVWKDADADIPEIIAAKRFINQS